MRNRTHTARATQSASAERPQSPIAINPACVDVHHTLLVYDGLGTLIDELPLLAVAITTNIDEGALLLHQLKREKKGLRASCELYCVLGGGAMLLKRRKLPCSSVNLGNVVLASVGTGTAGVVV